MYIKHIIPIHSYHDAFILPKFKIKEKIKK